MSLDACFFSVAIIWAAYSSTIVLVPYWDAKCAMSCLGMLMSATLEAFLDDATCAVINAGIVNRHRRHCR